MNKICPTCKSDYDDGGDAWKKLCYACYKNYKNYNRIERIQHKIELYITHPTVTKEELAEWIAKNQKPRGWGPELWNPEDFDKFKIWTDDTNFD